MNDRKDSNNAPTITSLVASLANQAFAFMGGAEDPETKKPLIDLGFVRYTIDTIDMLKEKTKGNLTSEEESFIDGTLYTLKMTFVKVSATQEKAKSQAKSAERQHEEKKTLDETKEGEEK